MARKAPPDPDELILKDIASEDRELLKMLATNGRYKPKTDSPKSSSG